MFAIDGTAVNAVVAVNTVAFTAVYVAVVVAAAAVTAVVAVSAGLLLPFLLFSLCLGPIECYFKSSSVSVSLSSVFCVCGIPIGILTN